MPHSVMERPGIEGEAGSRNLDPAHFAWCVGQFALDAHRILNDPFATAHDLVELSGLIDALWRQCPAKHSDSLDLWLRTARSLVRSRDSLRD